MTVSKERQVQEQTLKWKLWRARRRIFDMFAQAEVTFRAIEWRFIALDTKIPRIRSFARNSRSESCSLCLFSLDKTFVIEWILLAYRIRFAIARIAYLTRLESLANILRSARATELESLACPCITDISVQSISRYKGKSPLCHSRHGQTLANAYVKRLSAFLPLSCLQAPTTNDAPFLSSNSFVAKYS